MMMKINNWVSLYKPVGLSSFDLVRILKRNLRLKKIGHGGTLDPLAEGVLPIAICEATKTIQFCQDLEKEYEFTVQFGATTETLDREGEITATTDKIPTEEEILAILPEFIGNIEQMPPIYSALKLNGKKACDLARSGQQVELAARQVLVNSLDLKQFNHYTRTAEFIVKCGKGTYVRSLARDIAQRLGSLGYVTKLKRTKVGPFDLTNSLLISDDKFSNGDFNKFLLPVDIVLDDILVLDLSEEQQIALRQGKKLEFPFQDTELVRCSYKGEFFAIASIKNSVLIVKRIFNL